MENFFGFGKNSVVDKVFGSSASFGLYQCTEVTGRETAFVGKVGDRQEALEMLTVDIVSAWSNLQEATEQVAVAQTAVEQADENMRHSLAKYKAGTEPLSNLLDAETLQRQSQDNLHTAFASYELAKTKYQLKVGR